jgi:ppGpp synthetase/RelA/SpoT-type nucleotidyltranferase
MTNVELVLREFDARRSFLEEYSEALEGAVKNILLQQGREVFKVDARVKDRKSLEEKITRKGDGYYQNLLDITDLVGVRVVVQFEDEARAVGELLRKELVIDAENSIDKSDLLGPSVFGYRTIQLIASLPGNEHRFEGVKGEVQVRSLLQHAWAAADHKLVYKSALPLSDPLKRRLSAVAAVLELMDQELCRVRDDAFQERSVSLSVPAPAKPGVPAVAVVIPTIGRKAVLFKTHSDIVGNLSRVLGRAGLLSRMQTGGLREGLRVLGEWQPLPPEVTAGFGLFEQIRNRAAHTEDIDEDAILSGIRAGSSLLAHLESIALSTFRVKSANVPIFSDSEGRNVIAGATAVILETTEADGTPAPLRAFPTTKSDYEPGVEVSWEWSGRNRFSEAWYRNPESPTSEALTRGWSASMEFVGRNLNSISLVSTALLWG